MNIVMLRTNSCQPDPRVEKEANSLLLLPEDKLRIVCWDRDGRKGKFQEDLELANGSVPILRFGIPASWGGGMKANFFPMLKFEWKLFWWLMLHSKEYDTVHACDLLTGLPAWLPCKLFGKKMVYDIFDYYAATTHGPQWLLNIFSKLENGIINSADATIICSEQRTEQIAGTKPKKLVVLHNAPSAEQVSHSGEGIAVQGDPDKMKIVYVGNLVEDRFIMKALACADKMPQVEFHIGGFGALEEQVKALSETHENIYFYGKLAYKDVLALERQCNIMLALYDPAVPNHAYAAPNKFYEALALGKPLVMFHKTGMDGIVAEHGIGAVCEPTEDGLRAAFEELLNRQSEWEGMSQTMRTLFEKDYCWDIMEKRLVSLYQEL